jgi:hypothetical protein
MYENACSGKPSGTSTVGDGGTGSAWLRLCERIAAARLGERVHALDGELTPRGRGKSSQGVALRPCCSPGCAAIVFGLTQSNQYQGFGNAHVLVPLATGIALLAAFCLNALRIPHALIDLRLFARRGFASASATMFVSGFVLFGAMGALPLYYQIARGDTAQRAGLLLIPLGIGMGLSLFAAGRLADRIVPRTIALAGLLFTAAGTFVYTQLAAGTSQLLLGVAQVCSGIGTGAATQVRPRLRTGPRLSGRPRTTAGLRTLTVPGRGPRRER